VKDNEVIDAEFTEVASHSGAIERAAPVTLSKERLAELGVMLPVVDPAELRAAFAEKQRLYAAILDENDYLYTVAYREGSQTRQYVSPNKSSAEKYAQQYSTQVIATPKKSGIVKLARALGITAKRTLTRGLPEDAGATYSYVVYEATHGSSGTTEQGIGWCDTTERGGKISRHDIIATADTRAYNRAILRLSGFGDVSADEVIAGPVDDAKGVIVADPPQRRADPLPAIGSVEVTAAQSTWARAFSEQGKGAAPAPRQSTLDARMQRARARRGDVKAAQALGSSGLLWQGRAQDSANTDAFEVESPIITPESVAAAAAETTKALEEGLREEAKKTSPAPASAPAASTAKPGLDLTGNGPEFNDVDPPWEAKPTMVLADPKAETITTTQAKKLSAALMEHTSGDRDKARQWLRDHTGCEKSTDVKGNQYEVIMKLLEKKEAQGG
jgi:hypothetical protein